MTAMIERLKPEDYFVEISLRSIRIFADLCAIQRRPVDDLTPRLGAFQETLSGINSCTLNSSSASSLYIESPIFMCPISDIVKEWKGLSIEKR
jgi:hypothetical protein